MFSIALVLSAGGSLGEPWHFGVLSRLQEMTGWDARTSDLIVGTSAGAIAATSLRTGVTPHDRVAQFRGEPVSDEGTALYGRITTEYSEPEVEQDRGPLSLKMSLNAAWPPWNTDPVRVAMGAMPRGTRSGEPLEARMNELHPERWPAAPTWIVAVRIDDGRRIVFGRDDVVGNIGEAVRASAAVPGFYIPGKIGKREYIDGAVHSSTNADLCATLGFDAVIVSSVMTATSDSRNWISDSRRAWFSRKLDEESDEIRRRGTPVIVFEPDKSALEGLSREHDDFRVRTVAAGEATVDRVMAGAQADGLRELMARAIG